MRLIVALVVVIGSVANANAEPITFINSGSGSGRINGVRFATTTFTITSTADTSNRHAFFDGYFVDHSTSTIAISGVGTFSVISPTQTFVTHHVASDVVGYGLADPTPFPILEPPTDLFVGPTDSAFHTWDILTAIGPVSGDTRTLQWFNTQVSTSGGTLAFFDGTSPGSFQAIVPEPSSIVLACAGMIGLALVGYRQRAMHSRTIKRVRTIY